MLAASLSACASSQRAGTAPVMANAFVTLEKPAGDSLWLATWHLPAPVTRLKFIRPAARFRKSVFVPVTPGYVIDRDGEYEILKATAAPSSTVAIRTPQYSEFLDKEYEFFSPFTDGGVAIFTGHLLAVPVYSGNAAQCDSCPVKSFRFIPSANSEVIAGGKKSSTPLEWTDKDSQGTYVYFGRATPVATPDIISIIDPGLPQWLATRTKEFVPRLFDLYRRKFAVAPTVRPTVFFNYGGNKNNGFTNGGGTLPGIIQLTAEGKGWDSETHQGTVLLFHFLGHESAHIWNGELASYRGDVDSWMHEGSADAIGERALMQLGVINADELADYETGALNTCAQGISSSGVHVAAKRTSQLYYSCGNLIALLTESAITPGKDLFDFWRTLIARARSGNGSYSATDYFAVMKQLGASEAAIDDIELLIENGADISRIERMLDARGIKYVGVENPPSSYGQTLSRQATLSLLGESCTGRHGFRADRTGFIVDSGITCTGIPAGSTITHIGGKDVLREGHLAWDYLHNACGPSASVSVTLISGNAQAVEVRVPCTRAVPARPPYIRIVNRTA